MKKIGGKYGLDHLRKYPPQVDLTGRSKTDAHRERQGGDGHVPLGKSSPGKHLDPRYHDGPEHHDRAPAQKGFREGCKKVPHRWQESGQQHTAGPGGNGKAVYDLRHVHEPHILGK